MGTFSPTEAIKFGWETFKKNPSFLVILVILLVVVEVVISMIFKPLTDIKTNTFVVSSLFSMASSIVASFFTLGFIKAILTLVNTGKGNFSDIYSAFTNTKLLVNYLIASIIVSVAVSIGFILLILPGVYLSLRLTFFTYFLVDKNMGAMDAIQASWNATKGNVWNLIILGFLGVGLIILGALALIVGLLVTIPILLVASAHVYKELSKGAASEPAPVPAVDAPMAPPPTPAAT